MDRTRRILNIWLHGKLKLCKKMENTDHLRKWYFAAHNYWPVTPKDAESWITQRWKDVKEYNKQQRSL